MPKDKFARIFSCQMEAIVFINLQVFFATHAVSSDIPQYSVPNTTVVKHFLSHHNHGHTDMQLVPLKFIHSFRDLIRKVRELFLID